MRTLLPAASRTTAASACSARSPYSFHSVASASSASRSRGSTERSPCSTRLSSRASSSFIRCGPASVGWPGFTAPPPDAPVVLMKPRRQQGGTDQGVRHAAQSEAGRLGLLLAAPLCPPLPGLVLPPETAQAVG